MLGSDGLNYASECHLGRSSCQNSNNVSLKFAKGACDPCATYTCPEGRECHLDDKRRPHCRCVNNCDTAVQPVCASDGNTYRNLCTMKLQSCRRDDDLHVVYNGNCSQSLNPCQSISCSSVQICNISKKGIAKCTCPRWCEPKYSPVCGSDGVTYDNSCHLQATSCQTQTQIKLTFKGLCGSESGCSQLNCGQFGLCSTSALGSKCTCPTCGEEYDPVCGSDGNVYDNLCKLQAEACATQQDIHKVESAQCGGCLGRDCSFYSVCVSGRCSCPDASRCRGLQVDTVCGTDGQTYDNVCALEAAACQRQQMIQVKHKGYCDSCLGVACRAGGLCVSGQCVCPRDCPREMDPVCGSDEQTYSNECELRKQSCDSGSELTLLHTGECIFTTVTKLATTRSSTSKALVLIGDVCIEDSDCSPLLSTCPPSKAVCSCPPGTAPARHQTACVKVRGASDEVSWPDGGCDSEPCQGGGTCEDHDGIFTCFCPDDRTGLLCEKKISQNNIQVAGFTGRSLVELETMKRCDHKVNLEVEFRTERENGLLVYSQQQQDGGGDFISLAVVNGYVEFRYNLGNGPVTIRSRAPIALNAWHKVVAKRWHQDGMLRVDSHREVEGRTDGDLRSLDLRTTTLIGFTGSNVTQVHLNIGTNQGLKGCIRKLKLGHSTVKLQSSHEPTHIRDVGLKECGRGDPCHTNPCQNQGICQHSSTGDISCLCPAGFLGPLCQHRMDRDQEGSNKKSERGSLMTERVPNFNGVSFISLPTLEHIGRSLHIEVWFLTRSLNGMILYNGQNANGHGDFISLNLINGHVQYRYDLGSGIANITSPRPVTLNTWHKAKLSRQDLVGTLQINGGSVVQGKSTPPLAELNLGQPLFLGGFRYSYSLSPDSSIVIGLNGAIQRLIVNGNSWTDLVERSGDSRAITEYKGAPCNKNPCKNGGKCRPNFRTAVCKCSANFTGQYCTQGIWIR